MSVKVIDSFRIVLAKNDGGLTPVGSVEADADNDTLTLIGGTGIALGVDPANDAVTINALGLDQLLSSALGRITIFADDSTLRVVQGGESFGILGTGAVTTTSNVEGDIAINVSTDLSTFDNSTSLFVSQGNNISLLTNDANYITNATASINANQVSGLATVATTGTYSDLTTRPNITFTTDVTGSTGGQLSGGAQNIALTLSTTGVAAGTYNNVTVDTKGRVTSASNLNYIVGESDTLDTVTTRGNVTSNDINVGGLTVTSININGAYSLPTTVGADNTVLKYKNGQVIWDLGGGGDGGSGDIFVAADDSAIQKISAGEVLSILGSGQAATTSNAEGAITITVSADLSTYDNSTSQFLAQNDNISLLVNNVGYITTESDTLATVTGRGAITSTPIAINDSSNYPFTVTGSVNNTASGPFITVARDRGINVANNDYLGGLLVQGKNSNNALHDYGSIVYQIKDKTLNSETSIGVLRSYQSGSEIDSITYGNGFVRLYHDTILEANKGLWFDGVTADSNYTKLVAIDPTGNNVINIPNASGTIALDTDLTAYTQQNTQHVGSLKGNVYANDGVTVLVDSVNGNVPAAETAGTADALYQARPFQITGVVTAGAINFNGTSGVTLNTTFTNNNISQFNNDAGFVTQGLSEGSNLSLFTNDVGFITAFSVAADDSTTRIINGGETIQFAGSGAVTTSSDAEGKITITASNNLSDYNNDAGFNTQNDVITLYGDITGSGRTSINTSLNLNLSNISPGTYNYIEFDTRGIAQTGVLKPYVEAGSNISQFTNDAGYLTGIGSGLRFIGDDSTGFNVPAPGNDIRFEGTRGISVFASGETVTIQGPFSNTGALTGDIQGSVFADDSTLLVNALDGRLVTETLDQSGAADGEVLAWSNALNKWHPVNLTSGGAVQYTDAQVDARIVNAGSANWNTAYGWGDHAQAGYFTTAALSTTSIHELYDVNTVTNPPVAGNVLKWNAVSSQWEPGIVQPAPLAITDLTDTPSSIPTGSKYVLTNNSGGTAVEWTALSTSNIVEGSNLYYTQSRAFGDFDTRLATKTTNNLAEGNINFYFSQSRFDNAFGAKSTDDLVQGLVNKYYTDAQVDARFNTKTTDNLTEGTTRLYFTNARADARIALASVNDLADIDTTTNPPNAGQTLIWNAVQGKWVPGGSSSGTGIQLTNLSVVSSGVDTLSYNNSTGVFTFNGISNTGGLPEGSNLYFTNARADARADIRIAAAELGDLNNVAVTPATAGQALVWNGAMWAPGTVNTEDSYKFSIGADDSTLRIINNGESIKFIGTNGITTSSDAEGNITISGGSFLSTSSSLGDLGDVTITGTPTTGHVLKWDGVAWTPAPDLSSGGAGIALTDLSVTTNSPGNSSLQYNNTSGVFTFTPPDLSSYVTASSASAFTNKTGNISQWTNDSGYITGISGSNVTTALGFTPYNATNPSGYISNTVIDDDTFATASATNLPSAESVKAYVDTYSTVANTSDTTAFVALYDSQTGLQSPKSNTQITFNGTTGVLSVGTLETATIQAPATITGTWTLSSPTSLTLDAGTEVKVDAPVRHVVKALTDLGSLTVTTGAIVLVSDANYAQFMYDGSNWKPVATPTYYYDCLLYTSPSPRDS